MIMTDRLFNLMLAVLLALALAACGGSGGEPDNDTTEDPPAPPPPVTMVSATFVDAAVDGLNFTSSPSATSGTTGGNGTPGGLTVASGDTATFDIGGLVLGTSQAISDGDIITPAELAGNPFDADNPRAIRIARLLQSLDDDGNSGNGILITANTHDYISSGLSQAERDSLQTALNTGTDFRLLFSDRIHLMTAGNSVPRLQGDFVNAAQARLELAVAVSHATGGGGFVGDDSEIVADPTESCPVGVLSSNRVEVFSQSFPVCVINTDITNDVTLKNDHVYVIEGIIRVGNGDALGATGSRVILLIQPGTQIYGYGGTTASLIITRGSMIEAIGLPELPIIMGAVDATGSGANLDITSDPADLTGRGQWSGLIISGRGTTTAGNATGEAQATSVPQGMTRFYGGQVADNNSGTLEYVIIAEAGRSYTETGRMHGLTLEAVGSATRLNHLQVLGSDGDGIRWFGGGASTANLIVNGQFGDGLSFSEGFNGLVQRALVRMGSTVGDKGMAGADNAIFPNAQARPNFINVTLLGKDGGVGSTSIGVAYRDGVDAVMWRSAILDDTGTEAWDGGCLGIEGELDLIMAFRDVAVSCQNGIPADAVRGGTFGVTGALTESFVEGTTTVVFPLDQLDFSVAEGIPFNADTLAIDTWTTFDHPPTSVPLVFFEAEIGNYFGAVDPASGNPDGDPTNNDNGNGGGPFWDGWTYRHSNVEGGLPGVDFHPLEAELTP